MRVCFEVVSRESIQYRVETIYFRARKTVDRMNQDVTVADLNRVFLL